MYIEEPKKNKNGELVSNIYFTKEETALFDEEDKKLLKPCDKTIYSFQFKLPEGVAPKHYCNVITPTDEGFNVELDGEIKQEIIDMVQTAEVLYAEYKGIELDKEQVDKIKANKYYEDMKARMTIDGKPAFLNNKPLKYDSLEELKTTIKTKFNESQIEIL